MLLFLLKTITWNCIIKSLEKLIYGREVTNGIYANGKLLYMKTVVLYSTTRIIPWLKNDDLYFQTIRCNLIITLRFLFENHHIIKLVLERAYVLDKNTYRALTENQHPKRQLSYFKFYYEKLLEQAIVIIIMI